MQRVRFPVPIRGLPALALMLAIALPARATLFRLPLDRPDEIDVETWGVIHADHDPADGGTAGYGCLAFDGSANFPNCYDAHDGTDYLLRDNWVAMDEERVTVLAAADGEVISVADGNYDRCHLDLGSEGVSCDGYPMVGNHVKIRHADGMESWYWHFKKDTILVDEGDTVRCGDPLGFVGSSGYSTGPHLHFEVRTAAGAWIDPYAGPFSQPQSYWVQQVGAYGLPGAWCEGDEVPPEPEPVPEPVPDAPGDDAATVSEPSPDVFEAVSPDADSTDLPPGWDGTTADVPGDPGDPGASDPGAARDAVEGPDVPWEELPLLADDMVFPPSPSSGWGCAASAGLGGTSGVSAALSILLALVALVLARARRGTLAKHPGRGQNAS
jgi:hypothetical protein